MAKNRKGRGSRGRRRQSAEDIEQQAVEVVASPELPNMPSERDLEHHLQNIKGWKDKAATAQKHLSDARKKAREAGISIKAIMVYLGYERADTLDVATELGQLSILMRRRGHPVQMQLYDLRHGDPAAQAKAEGYADGRAAKTPNAARWPETSPQHAIYMAAWNDGQKDNLAPMAQDAG